MCIRDSFKANLDRLPAPAGREQQIQQFSLIPALTTLSGNQAEVLGNLISDLLDMKQFQTAQENFVEKAVRSSFFITCRPASTGAATAVPHSPQ